MSKFVFSYPFYHKTSGKKREFEKCFTKRSIRVILKLDITNRVSAKTGGICYGGSFDIAYFHYDRDILSA